MKTDEKQCDSSNEPRCDACIWGKLFGKDYFGAGAVICKRYPQEYRKNPDDYCGEFDRRVEVKKDVKKKS